MLRPHAAVVVLAPWLAVVCGGLVPSAAHADDLSWAERWLVGSRAVATLGDTEASDPARERAARELAVVGAARPAVRALLAARDDGTPAVASAVDGALVRRGGPEVVAGLVTALAHASGEDRLALRHALAALGGDAATRAVVAQIGAGDPDLTLATDLARLGPSALPRLVRAATETHGSPAVLVALGMIGDARALPTLVAALRIDSTPVRIAAATGLRELGDPRASHALVAALDEPSPAALMAMLSALSVVGEPDAAAAIRTRLHHPDADVRAAALRALVGVDAAGAVPVVRESLHGSDARLAATARDVLVATRHAALAPLLAAELPRDARPAEVAGALATLDDGAGIPALRACIAPSGRATRPAAAVARHCVLALAIATRTQRGDRSALQAVIVGGRAQLDADSAFVARALALDAGVAPYLVHELASPRALRRATAAHALALLAPADGLARDDLGAAVVATLTAETDPEAYRREADAALALGATPDLDELLARTGDPAIAPETLALVARVAATTAAAARRRALAALHDALRDGSPRTRAAAAHALAAGEGAPAAPTLLAALAHEEDGGVRLALASAAASLGIARDRELAVAAAGLARIADDRATRDALLAPAGVAQRGTEVLHVRFAGATRGVVADVRLPDGRTVRIAPLPGGDLVLADLPRGTADVLATRAP